MRALWMAADQRLCACDELQMASSRLRLMTPYEILLGYDVPSTINPFEVCGVWCVCVWGGGDCRNILSCVPVLKFTIQVSTINC